MDLCVFCSLVHPTCLGTQYILAVEPMTAEQVKAQLTTGGRPRGVVYSPEGDGREPGQAPRGA